MSAQVAWKLLLSRMVSSPKVWKSRFLIASVIFDMRSGTTLSTRAENSVEVATVACMPAVLLTSFFFALATRMMARMPGQWDEAGLGQPDCRFHQLPFLLATRHIRRRDCDMRTQSLVVRSC